jgi:hypothetical protein
MYQVYHIQGRLPCAIVYLMNLRIPPKLAIKGHLETEMGSSVCSILNPCFKLKMKLFLFINLIKNSSFPYLNLSHLFSTYIFCNAAVMSRPFEFRGRGLAWEIFLTRSPLFFSAKAEEI